MHDPLRTGVATHRRHQQPHRLEMPQVLLPPVSAEVAAPGQGASTPDEHVDTCNGAFRTAEVPLAHQLGGHGNGAIRDDVV